MRRTRMAAVAAVAAGAVVVATVLVVSRGEDGDEAFSVPVVAGAALPAGTELWDGMRVPAGARLLGRVFPPDDAPQREGGFAVLAVDGDPLAVYETLARQARRLGFDNAEPDAEACLSFEISGRTRQYDVVQAGQEVTGVQCSTETSVQRPGRDAADGAYLTITLTRGPTVWGYVSHATISQQGEPPTAGPADRPRAAPIDVEVARPERDLEVASPGESIFASAEVDTGALRVLAGSELVAPPSQGSSSLGGFVAIFRLGDDPAPLLDPYRQSVARLVGVDDPGPAAVFDDDVGSERVIRQDVVVPADGSRTRLTAYVPHAPGEPAWLVIDHNHG